MWKNGGAILNVPFHSFALARMQYNYMTLSKESATVLSEWDVLGDMLAGRDVDMKIT